MNEKITSSSVGDLFSRLEAIRLEHKSATNQSASAITSLTPPYEYTPTQYTTILPETVSYLKQYLTNLSNSDFITNDYGADITTPARGDLIRKTELDSWDTAVTTVDNLCPHNSGYNSTYDAGYRGSYYATYDSSYDSGYRSSYRSSYNSSYKSSYKHCFSSYRVGTSNSGNNGGYRSGN